VTIRQMSKHRQFGPFMSLGEGKKDFVIYAVATTADCEDRPLGNEMSKTSKMSISTFV
jgi:hypothetical protein